MTRARARSSAANSIPARASAGATNAKHLTVEAEGAAPRWAPHPGGDEKAAPFYSND